MVEDALSADEVAALARTLDPAVRLHWEQAVHEQPYSTEPVLWHRSAPIGEECWGDWGAAVDVPDGAAVVKPAADATPGRRRPLVDPVLNAPVLRDGAPVPG